MKKKKAKRQEGYSPKELNAHMHAYIKASASRLRSEMREARKKRGSVQKRSNRTIDREKEGYSPEEMRTLTKQMIDDMIVRLHKRLREEKMRRERTGRVHNVRHEIAV